MLKKNSKKYPIIDDLSPYYNVDFKDIISIYNKNQYDFIKEYMKNTIKEKELLDEIKKIFKENKYVYGLYFFILIVQYKIKFSSNITYIFSYILYKNNLISEMNNIKFIKLLFDNNMLELHNSEKLVLFFDIIEKIKNSTDKDEIKEIKLDYLYELEFKRKDRESIIHFFTKIRYLQSKTEISTWYLMHVYYFDSDSKYVDEFFYKIVNFVDNYDLTLDELISYFFKSKITIKNIAFLCKILTNDYNFFTRLAFINYYILNPTLDTENLILDIINEYSIDELNNIDWKWEFIDKNIVPFNVVPRII